MKNADTSPIRVLRIDFVLEDVGHRDWNRSRADEPPGGPKLYLPEQNCRRSSPRRRQQIAHDGHRKPRRRDMKIENQVPYSVKGVKQRKPDGDDKNRFDKLIPQESHNSVVLHRVHKNTPAKTGSDDGRENKYRNEHRRDNSARRKQRPPECLVRTPHRNITRRTTATTTTSPT